MKLGSPDGLKKKQKKKKTLTPWLVIRTLLQPWKSCRTDGQIISSFGHGRCMCKNTTPARDGTNFFFTLNSEPEAFTGDKSEGIKSRGFFPRINPQLKPGAKNLMYTWQIFFNTGENYSGVFKKTKNKRPWAKSKTARSAARPPLGWLTVRSSIFMVF